ncbi:MAG: D-2-hydroxyacid dehydrogenase [Defluviitaleaceae bacterium]|nr:D-2-hydroxyacid dehydrogenase [Defluviitaleaceae bacterium]
MKRKLAVATILPLSDARLAKIRQAATDFEVICCDMKSEDMLDCEVVFGRPSPKVISKSAKLKWLHTQIAGVDIYLEPEVALGNSVMLTNSAGAYGVSIAEHLMAVTLMLLRRMGEYGHLQSAAKWENLGHIESLYGKTVAVVGLGDIGGNFAVRCRAMGAKVRGVVRTARAEVPPCADELYSADGLDTAIKGADVVALCLPSTAETTCLFNKERLLGMKQGSFLLNVGRGNAVDQDALIELLASGHLGGAGLDVTVPEPLPAESPLWAMPNVIITPHNSNGVTMDITLDLTVDRFIEYLQNYIEGKPFKRTVDRQAGY